MELVFDQPLVDRLFQRGGAHAQLRHALDDILGEVIPSGGCVA
jgi:hypothetical protein